MPSIQHSSLFLQAGEEQRVDKPPSSEASYPIQAFGAGTNRYWAFLEALFDGLLEFETMNGGSDHAH